MRSLSKRYLPPAAVLAAALATRQILPAILSKAEIAADAPGVPLVSHLISIVALWATALMIIRLLNAYAWNGLVARHMGEAPVELLISIVNISIWALAIGFTNHFVFGNPVGTILTGSGILVALLAFALKSLIADTFSGIALTLERPFKVGDWLDVGGGTIGKVVNLSWRATSLQLVNNLTVVIPNSRMSEIQLTVYGVWRDKIEIELEQSVTGEEVERMFFSAVGAISELQNLAPATARGVDFGANGVKWQLFYSLPDYPSRLRIRDRVIRNLYRNLHETGYSTAIATQRIQLETPAGRLADHAPDGSEPVVGRSDLLR